MRTVGQGSRQAHHRCHPHPYRLGHPRPTLGWSRRAVPCSPARCRCHRPCPRPAAGRWWRFPAIHQAFRHRLYQANQLGQAGRRQVQQYSHRWSVLLVRHIHHRRLCLHYSLRFREVRRVQQCWQYRRRLCRRQVHHRYHRHRGRSACRLHRLNWSNNQFL